MEKKGSTLKKIINFLFAAVIVAVMLAGLASTFLFPEEVLPDENRYANKVPPFTLSGYADGSYQTGVDEAMGDQVNLSAIYKLIYNEVSSKLLMTGLQPFLDSGILDGRYIDTSGISIFGGDHLVNRPYGDEVYAQVAEHARLLNIYIDNLPEDTEFYVYYIERDLDMDFEKDENRGFRTTLFERLNLPEDHMAYFAVENYAEYDRLFYKTDHHWNYIGAHQGYVDVLELLGCEDAPLEPLEAVTMAGDYAGWYAVGEVSNYSERFTAYRYDFPEMKFTINGESAENYGEQERYLSTGENVSAYGYFYGPDEGEMIIDTGRPERDSIMVVGESYDNAIIKLIASHFDKTYSIDLRHYERLMGEPFSLVDHVQKNDIDKVLMIGNVDFYRSPVEQEVK